MSQSENAFTGKLYVSNVFIFLPQGEQLFSGGEATFDTTYNTITCGPFVSNVLPVINENDYIITFQDANQTQYEFANCQCLSGSSEFTFLLSQSQPVNKYNIQNVAVMIGSVYLLQDEQGNWSQSKGTVTCGTFTENNLPIFEGNGYNVSFTSNGAPHNYTFCTCTASGAESTFSLD